MRALGQSYTKTLLGYTDKNLNKVGLLEDDQLPVLTEETYAPFLATRDHLFNVQTHSLLVTIKNQKTFESISKIKRSVANIMIYPGMIAAILFILKVAGVFNDSAFAEVVLQNKVISLAFWLSVLGILVLWHDYYREQNQDIKLPPIFEIPSKEIESIESTGFKFTRYISLQTEHFISEELKEILANYIEADGMYSLKIFSYLLTLPAIRALLKRADLDLSNEKLEENEISKSTIPDYPAAGFRSFITYSLEDALFTQSAEILPQHLFLSYFRVFPVLKKYLQKNNSSIDLLREIVRAHEEKKRKIESVNMFNIDFPYFRTGGVGKDWIYGYTFVLSQFSKDLNQEISLSQDKFGIGHEKEIENIISVIGRLTKKNILLIGEVGTGKSSLIKGLAQKINRGDVPEQLKDKRIIKLDVNGLIALGSSKGNLEGLIQKAMSELEKSGNTILYIDEIQEIIPTKAEKSGHNIAGILLPYLLEGKFPTIGTINYADYKKYFYTNESLRQSFENVEISELSPKDTLQILETTIPKLESNFKLYVTFPALVAAIELSQRYVSNRKLPDSAVRTLEAACSWAQSQKILKLTNEHVAKYVSIQTNIPVETITAEEATRLMNLEQVIKSRVIGQDEAVHSLVETLKRARTDIRDPNKPIGVFLFLGPTGTGKTHLAKVVADEYFNSRNEIIRIDMSEYQDSQSITKLLGTTENHGSSVSAGQSTITLLDRIKATPYSLVLFDEIEKAHPQVLDLFLQLFDEGRLTSNAGETVNFTNTIIVCTSNIGSKILLDALEKDKSLWDEAKSRALIEVKQVMRPELLNRFDDIIVFSPHTIENLVRITELLLNEVARRTSEKGVTLTWNKTIPMLIANKAQEPGMGARPLKRYIQEKIEGRLATELLSNELEAGDSISIKESWIV